MPGKTKEGGRKVRNIQSIEDWAAITTQERIFSRPDGGKDRFVIHALTGIAYTSLLHGWEQTEPSKPQKPKDKDGEARTPPHWDERMTSYALELKEWEDKRPHWFVLEGWAKPNKVEIPGETDAEKVDYLFKHAGIAGYAFKLMDAIIGLSQLKIGDVDFFSTGSFLGS